MFKMKKRRSEKKFGTTFKNLLLLIKKNLRILVRSKSSALIVIFAPLLLILLIGLSYSSSASYGLNIGLHANNFDGDINEVMTSLQNKGFKVVTYLDVDECLDDVKSNFVHACVSLPDNFQIKDNSAKEVTFYLDQSKINLVWIVQETLEEEFDLKTQELSQQLVSNIFDRINTAQDSIGGEQTNIASLQNSSSGLSSQSGALSSNLGSLDLIEIGYTSQIDVLEEFQSFSTANLNSADVNIDEAIEVLDDLNISGSEKEELEDLLTAIDADILDVRSLVSGTGNYTMTQILTIFEDLEYDLDNANQKISTANADITSIGYDVESFGTSLDDLSTSLSEVSSSLSSIKTSLSQFEVSEVEVIATPLVTNIEMISSESSNLDYVFPVLLTLVVMFLAIMLGSTLVMIEKTSQAYIRNFLVPIGKVVTVFGTLLTNLILIALQLIIILLISLFFIPDSWLSFPIIFVIMLIAATVFTLIGMVIGYLFTSEETGILASISTGSLLLFLSGVILPVEGMSPWLREFITLNPYVVTESLVREIFIFGSPFWTVWEEILILLFYGVVLFLGIMVIDSIIRKNLLKDMMFQKHKKYRADVAHSKELIKRRKIFKEQKGNISNWGTHETKTPVKKKGLFSGLFSKKK